MGFYYDDRVTNVGLGLQLWRLAVNILNKQSQSPAMRFVVTLTNSHCKSMFFQKQSKENSIDNLAW